MPQFKILREIEMPDEPEVNSIYLVAPPGSEFCEIYIVGNTVDAIRRIPTLDDIPAGEDGEDGGLLPGTYEDPLIIIDGGLI